MSARGWSAATTLGINRKMQSNTERFGSWRTLSGFNHIFLVDPGFSLRSNPGLTLANAFGVIKAAPRPIQATSTIELRLPTRYFHHRATSTIELRPPTRYFHHRATSTIAQESAELDPSNFRGFANQNGEGPLGHRSLHQPQETLLSVWRAPASQTD